MCPTTLERSSVDGVSRAPDSGSSANWQRFPWLALGLAVVVFGFLLVPRVNGNTRLAWSVAAAAAALVAWTIGVWLAGRKRGRAYRIECAAPLKSHYIQGSVQICVYVYWGWYWRDVYAEVPLFLAQLVFLYAFDALLSWSRGRDWRLGCGPLPIILSTNIFIWFKDDWYFLQFALVATAALGKEFIRWQRDGRRTHVFNPSAFGLGVVSLILIATGTTQLTWGPEIASTLGGPPHIYLEIFLLGLVVQYFFSVTLMTASAAAVLVALDLAYRRLTGTYFFVDTNLPIAIFLGLHLLVTDPSTSPRTNLGRVIFGGLYGLGNFVLYWVFESTRVPEFYDKLIPVLALNLGVRAFDRWATSGILGRFTRWEQRFAPRRLNFAHMACWGALFAWMLGSGYVEAPHPGSSLGFWSQAYLEGKPGVGKKLFKLAGSQAEHGSGAASNLLGMLYIEGRVVERDDAAAAHYFSTASELGDLDGSANVLTQFLFLREARSDRDVALAFERLEAASSRSKDGRACYLLGCAYEFGKGRPLDPARAEFYFRDGAASGDLGCRQRLAQLQGAAEARTPPAPLAWQGWLAASGP